MNTKHARIALATLACCAALVAAAPAGADDAADKAKNDAMMAEMMKNAAPGPDHKALEPMVGTWKATVKSWWAPGEPQVTEGTMVNSMVMGGRVLEGRFSGTMMGQPFKGLSMMGYDNAKKQYWSTWVDDMSTALVLHTGGPMKDKSIVLTGMAEGMDGKPMECTSTTKIIDANTHVYSMTGKIQGKDTPLMEITYKR